MFSTKKHKTNLRRTWHTRLFHLQWAARKRGTHRGASGVIQSNGDILQETASLPGHPQHRDVFRQHELAVSQYILESFTWMEDTHGPFLKNEFSIVSIIKHGITASHNNNTVYSICHVSKYGRCHWTDKHDSLVNSQSNSYKLCLCQVIFLTWFAQYKWGK